MVYYAAMDGSFLQILLVALGVVFFTSPLWLYYVLFKEKSYVRYLMLRLAETGALRPAAKGKGASGELPWRFWLVLPSAFLVQTLAVTALVVLEAGKRHLDSEEAQRLQRSLLLLMGVLGYASVFWGLILHFRPGAARTRKYRWWMFGLVIFWVLLLDGGGPDGRGVHQPGIDLHDYAWQLFLQGPGALLLLGCFGLLLAQPWAGRPVAPILRRLHGWLAIVFMAGLIPQRLGAGDNRLSWKIGGAFYSLILVMILFMLLLSPLGWQLLVFMMLLRYSLGERLARAPIVYLRSFRNAEGAAAFGRFVTQGASRYGVVVGLVHATQRSSDLHRWAAASDYGKFEVVTDEEWQDWVNAHLQRAAAVILDLSVETSSVQWELEQSLMMLGSQRVLFLRQEGSNTPVPEGVSLISYSAESARAEEELTRWFQELFFTAPPRQHANPREWPPAVVRGGVVAALALFVVHVVFVGARVIAHERERRQQEAMNKKNWNLPVIPRHDVYNWTPPQVVRPPEFVPPPPFEFNKPVAPNRPRFELPKFQAPKFEMPKVNLPPIVIPAPGDLQRK